MEVYSVHNALVKFDASSRLCQVGDATVDLRVHCQYNCLPQAKSRIWGMISPLKTFSNRFKRCLTSIGPEK